MLTSHPRPAGFSLAELLVGLALGGLVSAAALGALTRGRRAVSLHLARTEVSQNLRAALAIISAELRDVAGDSGGDILTMGGSQIAYRALRNVSFACREPDFGALTLTVGRSRSYGLRDLQPVVDDLWLFAEGDDSTLADDRWVRATMTGSLPGPSCADGTAGTTVALTGITSGQLAGVRLGAPARAFEVAELTSYRDAGGEWWLGYRTRDKAGLWSTVQPLAGPLAANGLQFSYWNRTGGAASAPSDVAGIGVDLVGVTSRRVRGTGGALLRDTIRLGGEVTLRNLARR